MTKRFDWLGIVVAGVRHHRSRLDLEGLSSGTELTLAREPTNAFDKNAVRIDLPNGDKLGYIPRTQAAWIAPLLDHSFMVDAVVDFVEAARFEVAVTLRLAELSEY